MHIKYINQIEDNLILKAHEYIHANMLSGLLRDYVCLELEDWCSLYDEVGSGFYTYDSVLEHHTYIVHVLAIMDKNKFPKDVEVLMELRDLFYKWAEDIKFVDSILEIMSGE